MNDSTSAHVATDALEITHSPELWRLLLGLALWGLFCAKEFVPPLAWGVGAAGSWWCLRYPTWPATLVALRAPVRWHTPLLEIAALACMLGITAWVVEHAVQISLLSSNGGWAALAAWLLVGLWATGRYLIVRERSRRAPRI